MKRKFLFLVCAVLCILQANAYTTDDLLSDGWSVAPNFSSNKDYVYVFVDAGSGEYVMTSNPSDAGARPQYMALVNPFTNPKVVWTIESRNDGYALRNIDTQYYFNTNTNGYDNFMASTYETGSFDIIANGVKYDLKRISGTQGDGWYVGPWGSPSAVNTSAHPGGGYENIAANKATSLGFYIYQMAKATYAKKYLQNCPNLTGLVDLSFMIENPTIYQAGANTSLPTGWSNYGGHDTDDGRYTESTLDTRLCAYRQISAGFIGSETGKLDFDYYTSVASLPKGKYRVNSKVSITEHIDVYLYICGASKESVSIKNQKNVVATTGYLDVAESSDITIGMEADASKTVWNSTNTLDAYADNFQLQVNPYLSTMATGLSFPGSVSLTAGVWYYYDIPAANSYDFTSSAAATISYTTAADPLLDAATTSEAFTTGQTKAISLPKGRVYFKASAATTFSVEYSYNVGSVTLSSADGSYIQNNTFSVNFPDAATKDPNASAALVASSKATVNGNEVALSSVTNGFSLNLGSLTANTDYVISIPAGVYGYTGHSMNSAINVTLHTPAAFDGVYCLYDADDELFLGRGANHGTEASADKYGIPFNLVTDASGVSSIEFVDWTGVYLFITGTAVYTDNASTGWRFVPTTDGFYLRNSDLTVYTTHSSGSYGEYLHTTVTEGEATVWTLKTKSERDAIIAAYPAENMSNVIIASGISTTAGDFETFLSNNCNSEDLTSLIGTATFTTDGKGDWDWSQVRAQDNQPAYGAGFAELWNATGTYSQTIGKENLPAGIYKITVQGYERRKANVAATALYTAGYNLVSTFLSANGEQVRFTDWNEVEEKPTNTSGAVTAFGKGEAVNTVYVYLDGNTDLTLMVRKPNYIWDCWIIFNNFTLTRYDQTEVTMKTSKAGSYGTFIAPFDVEIPSGITAYTVTGHEGNRLTLSDVDGTIPANTPVVVYSDNAINQTFKGKDGSNGVTSYSEGLLTGFYTAQTIPAGSYVLQTQDNRQAFYKLASAATANQVNRAYLTVPASNAKAFFFYLDDADAINDVRSKMEDGRSEIFNLAGQRVSKLQKGVNIVNGKKVLVK